MLRRTLFTGGIQLPSDRFLPLALGFLQGQARGYGRITHEIGRTTGGHYFQDLFTATPLDIHNFLGYQMKDLNIVFPKIPHNTL